ncbi:Transcription-repair coupling factor [hydrothermal vent metagenome]|uniref:Transcription-repair coupling factor n=1 Tax=hydrothermal vent metagenome TaxID=652676 RepID=A0A3B1E6I5_9ZZZZ
MNDSAPAPAWLDAMASDEAVAGLARALTEGRRAVVTGAAGSSTSILAGLLARSLAHPVVLVVAHIDEADDALDELTTLGLPALRLPALEVLPGETDIALDLFAERIAVQRAVMAMEDSGCCDAPVLITPIQALMQGVPAPDRLPQLARTLRAGEHHNLTELTQWLAEAGYSRVDAIEEPGDFAVRGGILDIFPPGGTALRAVSPPSTRLQAEFSGAPVRLDFFGDEIDRINEIDLDTMGSDRKIEAVELIASRLDAVRSDSATVNFLDLIPPTAAALLAETLEVVEQGRGYYERTTDGRGLFGPPAVLKILETRFVGFAEVNQFSAGAASADIRIELPVSPLPEFSRELPAAMGELIDMAREGSVVVACQKEAEAQRLGELLAEHASKPPKPQGGGLSSPHPVRTTLAYIHRGFVWHRPGTKPDQWGVATGAASGLKARPPGQNEVGDGETNSLYLIPYHELLHRIEARHMSSARRLKAGRAMDTFLDLAVGDYVVHADHGIAIFTGLKLMKPKPLPGKLAPRKPEPEEYLILEFAGKSRYYVPASTIDQVQKYVGGFHGKPPLSTLGGKKWKAQKDRVIEGVRDLAAEMLRVRAARESMPGVRYPADTAWQKEFEAEFPYEETEDQLAALAEIKKDMSSDRPMDRLICGDVGFGKTELAIRAAFKACEFGKQVAVLVPTTVLAEQHERTFRSRFADYPFRVASLSRFKTTKETNATLAGLRRGDVGVVIGTHRILSKDVRFADLGLVVIDEEQRFGVEHKERLLRLRLTVDVMTLSATPIPRTLHMSMLGLRDISSLTTPPLERRAIVTDVIPYNSRRIAQAIARELSRGGQIYFVHNRVRNIRSIADEVRTLAPDARIVVGHGQMPSGELEEVMIKFMRKEADILVSTTIIESGIDIPTANTMIINDADRFGLADLHQLRGRVGRSRHRAYCYMLLPIDRPVREVAQKRLKAIEQYSMLGAGFKIAMRDLEIRGAGNILGPEQSGHIAAVGYDMYCQLLERAVHELKHDRPPEQPSATKVDIGLTGILPKAYIPSDQRRLEAYRRLATAATVEQLEAVRADLIQAYGPIPKQAERLLDLAQLRIAAAHLGINTITVRERDVVFRCDDPTKIVEKLSHAKGQVISLRPKTNDTMHEVYYRPPESYMAPETLGTILRARMVAM